jgi:hypothetical protein
MADPTILGRFLWHELLTTDTASAAAFFTKIVGWTTKAWSKEPSYTMFYAGPRPVAGLMDLPEDARTMGAPPNWCTYIGTPDVDGTARLAVSLGGRILREPQDIPTYGRYAVLQDPQGAVFAVYAPVKPEPEASGVGGFSWHELVTADKAAALRFYQRLFDWEPAGSVEMEQGGGTYQMFGRNGKPVGGMFNKPPEIPHAYWLPYIRTADAKRTAGSVRSLRGKVLVGPMEIPGGDWIFVGSDRQGATFAVHSARPVAAKAAKKAPAKRRTKKTAGRKPARKATSRGPKEAARKSRSARKAGAGRRRR